MGEFMTEAPSHDLLFLRNHMFISMLWCCEGVAKMLDVEGWNLVRG